MPTTESINEWGNLKEVVVGRVENFRIPPNELSILASVPKSLAKIIVDQGGEKMPETLIKKADEELIALINVLEKLKVKVIRPDIPPENSFIQSATWSSIALGCACVRDGVLVVGDKIIETPMSWRSRYHETSLLYNAFSYYSDATWISAPKPKLLDSLFQTNFVPSKKGEPIQYVVNDSEIVFDAADFTRCGKDIFCQLSNATNLSGIKWLANLLKCQYNIHILEQKCTTPLHIDCTFVPVGPKRALINPSYLDYDALPSFVKDEWEIIIGPAPVAVTSEYSDFNMCSENLAYNLLMINPNLAIVDETQKPLIELLNRNGIECIPLSCKYLSPFGGSFHCFTLDMRRDE